MECEVCSLLNNDTSLVFQTTYWKVFVIDNQSYLGRCVISLKRHCQSLTDVNITEWKDLQDVVKKLETATKLAFGYDNVNWVCGMNNSFQKKPYNPHVHWHFYPRYCKPIVFEGKQFTDAEFGYHYDWKKRNIIDPDLIREIAQNIKKHIPN